MAKKSKNQNKPSRKKKKQLKNQAGLSGQQVSRAQLIELANKEKEANRRKNNEARRYNENRALLESVGLSPSIITKRTSKKKTQQLVDEEVKRQKAAAEAEKKKQKAAAAKAQKEALYESKINRLKEAGFSDVEARGIVGTIWKQISNAKVDEAIQKKKEGEKPPINDRIRLSSDEWLYVAYSETNHDMQFELFKNYTSDELLDKIRMRYAEATSNPSGSDSMVGVFIVESGDEETMKSHANDYYARGYNFEMRPNKGKKAIKIDSSRYYKLTLHNTYTMHNFLQLVLQVISNAKNEMVDHYMKQFKIYCKEAGFPFLDDL